MDKTIWKFELETKHTQILKMPVGAEILTVQTKFDKPCLWALVDPNAEKEDRFIEIFLTGHPVVYNMGVDRKYISTYLLKGGSLVFHVFEYTGV